LLKVLLRYKFLILYTGSQLPQSMYVSCLAFCCDLTCDVTAVIQVFCVVGEPQLLPISKHIVCGCALNRKNWNPALRYMQPAKSFWNQNHVCLALWRPLLPYVYSYAIKHPVPDWVKLWL